MIDIIVVELQQFFIVQQQVFVVGSDFLYVVCMDWLVCLQFFMGEYEVVFIVVIDVDFGGCLYYEIWMVELFVLCVGICYVQLYLKCWMCL